MGSFYHVIQHALARVFTLRVACVWIAAGRRLGVHVRTHVRVLEHVDLGASA